MQILPLLAGYLLFAAGIFFLFLRPNALHRRGILKNMRSKATAFFLSSFFLTRQRRKSRQRKVENEIYQSVTFLKNLAVIQKDTPKSGIYILEQLIPYTDLLSAPLKVLLHSLRMNRPAEGLAAFCMAADSKSAEGFGKLLISLDTMALSDLKETMEMYRRNIREEALTREKQKNEFISDLIYIPVMCNVMLIFVNFIYIAYYAQQKEMFEQLFF